MVVKWCWNKSSYQNRDLFYNLVGQQDSKIRNKLILMMIQKTLMRRLILKIGLIMAQKVHEVFVLR